MPVFCIDCAKAGIKKYCTYGLKGTTLREYCKDCSTKYVNYVNVKRNHMCQDCKILRPSFGIRNSKIAICCSVCNKLHHSGKYVSVVNKMCQDCGLVTPRFGEKGTKIPICCSNCNKLHHNSEYVNVRTKICINCNLIQPSFGKIGTKKAICCYKCNIKYHNREYVNIKDNTCSDCNVTRPHFGKEGTKIPICCRPCNDKFHKGKYVDVTHKKCNNDWCGFRAVDKYKGYCLNCFRHEYPDHKFVRNYKCKELLIVDSVKQQEFYIYEDSVKIGKHVINWKFDKPIGGSKRRPDIFYKFGNYYLLVDIDENQHRGYDCEDNRLIQLLKDAGMNIVIIRFNPDSYINHEGNKVESCFRNTIHGTKLNKENLEDWGYRLRILHYYMQKFIRYPPTKLLTVLKLFYDGYNHEIDYFKNI